MVNNEFTRPYKGSQRPPRVTRSEWDRAGDVGKWGYQNDWSKLFPDEQVKLREFTAPKTKDHGTKATGEGTDPGKPGAGPPAAPAGRAAARAPH